MVGALLRWILAGGRNTSLAERSIRDAIDRAMKAPPTGRDLGMLIRAAEALGYPTYFLDAGYAWNPAERPPENVPQAILLLKGLMNSGLNSWQTRLVALLLRHVAEDAQGGPRLPGG